MVIGLKERALSKRAYTIYLRRKRRGDWDAEDAEKNWKLAEKDLKRIEKKINKKYKNKVKRIK